MIFLRFLVVHGYFLVILYSSFPSIIDINCHQSSIIQLLEVRNVATFWCNSYHRIATDFPQGDGILKNFNMRWKEPIKYFHSKSISILKILQFFLYNNIQSETILLLTDQNPATERPQIPRILTGQSSAGREMEKWKKS